MDKSVGYCNHCFSAHKRKASSMSKLRYCGSQNCTGSGVSHCLPSNSSNAALRTVSNRAITVNSGTEKHLMANTHLRTTIDDRRPSTRIENRGEQDLIRWKFSFHGLMGLATPRKQVKGMNLRKMKRAATKIENGTCGLIFSSQVLFSPLTS